jgi:hypothetical protein
MSYRDDRDADQARIAALETELAAERAKVAELEGRRSTALVLATKGALTPVGRPGAAQRWLGAPSKLALERQFEGAYPADKLENLVETIRSVSRDHGRFELMRSSLTWWSVAAPRLGMGTCVTIRVEGGATTLAVTDRTFSGGAVLVGLGGTIIGGLALPLLIVSSLIPLVVPAIMLGWLGSVYVGTRTLHKRAARTRAEILQQLFDALAREIEAALPRTS